MDEFKNVMYADEIILYKHSKIENPGKGNFTPHAHDYCELLFVRKGDLSYTVRGKRYAVKPYDLIISRPSEFHSIVPVSDTTYDRFNIIYDEKQLPFDLWSRIPDNLDIISLKKSPDIVNPFDKMDYYASCLEGVELRTALLSLTTEVYMNLIIETEKLKQGYEFEQTNEIITSAISYIENELKNIKGIEEIADALYITKSHLHHVFIKHMGITPKKYITMKRLSFIQRELSLGAKPTEVYEKYGFSDYTTFYRAYKSHYNRPPSSNKQSEPIYDALAY